jgi:hypothetical protein
LRQCEAAHFFGAFLSLLWKENMGLRSIRVILIERAWRKWRNILAHKFLAPIHVVFICSYRSALWRKRKLAHPQKLGYKWNLNPHSFLLLKDK